MSHLDQIKPLRGSVSSYKRWITRNLNQITKAKDESNLSIPFFELKSGMIKIELGKITDLEHQILAIYYVAGVSVDEQDRVKHKKEIEEYIDGVDLKLVNLEKYVSTLRSPGGLGHVPDPEPSIQEISEAIEASNLRFSKLKSD